MVNLSNREAGAEIVDACRGGDRFAFRELYDLYKDRVYSIALYFFHGDHVAASDVTQQVFLKLLANIGQYRGEAVFSTWLYRLVVNACLDEARVRKPRAAHFDRLRLEAVAGADSQGGAIRAGASGGLPCGPRLPRFRRSSESRCCCAISTTCLTRKWQRHCTAQWAPWRRASAADISC